MLAHGGRQAGGWGHGSGKGWLLPREQSPDDTPWVSLAYLDVSRMLAWLFCCLQCIFFFSWIFCCALCQRPWGWGWGACKQDRILFFPQARICFPIACMPEHLLS